MRVIVLTTSRLGTAGHHLPVIATAKGIEIVAVILSEGFVTNRSKRHWRNLKKIARIGVLGAFNGVRMRRWYGEALNSYCNIQSVEDTCRSLGIRFEKVPSTNSRQTQQLFKDLGADVAISLGNGYISPKVFTIPRHGMLNIHHEILPDYQNAQSIIWQLYNGSAETGYTIHKIDARIDTGDILLQEHVSIKFRDSLAETVTATLAEVFDRSAQGLKKLLENFHRYYDNARPQGTGKKYTTPSYRQYFTILQNFKRLRNINRIPE
ncbi:formyltransferase family protein [Polluticoccus soli]|uniref:formyltransferase family protein n=1 Tax=Polluticoccus soli TaxID=3034150 RepID=UPI0023E2CE5D|nr:formyltransferase family protein [Flavipsychrobacter sp. JY13-12]